MVNGEIPVVVVPYIVREFCVRLVLQEVLHMIVLNFVKVSTNPVQKIATYAEQFLEFPVFTPKKKSVDLLGLRITIGISIARWIASLDDATKDV